MDKTPLERARDELRQRRALLLAAQLDYDRAVRDVIELGGTVEIDSELDLDTEWDLEAVVA